MIRKAAASHVTSLRPSSKRTKKPIHRKGTKGHPYNQGLDHPDTTPDESVRIIARHIAKAEKDERIDLTLALTPSKTHQGGFTRPRDLRTSNWFPGGRYLALGKTYESPSPDAYEPHTVFLLESRHPVRFGIGRVDAHDHVVQVCRECDIEAVLRKFNSARAPPDALESMDKARWPWTPRAKIKRTVWWEKGEDRRAILMETGRLESPGTLAETGALDNTHSDASDNEEGTTAASSSFDSPRISILISDPSPPDKLRTTVPSFSLPCDSHSRLHISGVSRTYQTGSIPQPAQHPSGFTPSSPDLRRNLHTHPVLCVTETEVNINNATTADALLMKDSNADTDGKRQRHSSPDSPADVRTMYLPTLEATPFWRPLLTLTTATRPLALTLARLSRGLAHGLPFHSSMSLDDRKCVLSYSTRMRCMRLARMQGVTVEMAQVLAGARGGFVGLRFDVDAMGRGVGGEGLERPVPWDKRVIKVGVGNWYQRASEVKEGFVLDAREQVAKIYGTGGRGGGEDKGAFEVFGLDDWGRRICDETGEVVPWRQPSREEVVPPYIIELDQLEVELGGVYSHSTDPHRLDGDVNHRQHISQQTSITQRDQTTTPVPTLSETPQRWVSNQRRYTLKARVRELMKEHGYKIAMWRTKGSNKVIYP